jgi:hypothetical protein
MSGLFLQDFRKSLSQDIGQYSSKFKKSLLLGMGYSAKCWANSDVIGGTFVEMQSMNQRQVQDLQVSKLSMKLAP